VNEHTDLPLIEFGAVIFGLAIVARLARRIGIPALPLYLLVGLAFGQGGIAELPASADFIETGAEIVVILMLGLEFSARGLIVNVRRSTMGGRADFALNFTPGVIAGLLLEFDPIIAVLLGGVTYISSSGIVAKLVADLDRIGNQETPVILSILVIEDLAMVLYLPLVSGVLFGNTAMSTSVVVIGSLTAVIAVIAIAYALSDRLSAIALRRSSEALLLTLLGIALLVAGIAGHLNGSTAVGAFIVGVALSGKIVSQARGLLLPLRNLFAAIFFVFLGLQVDPRSMAYGLSARRARRVLYRHRGAGRRSRTRPRRAFSHLRHLSHAHRIAPLPILGLPHAS
jgi:CPA2 family monovalent cation:H+ antiporter-2